MKHRGSARAVAIVVLALAACAPPAWAVKQRSHGGSGNSVVTPGRLQPRIVVTFMLRGRDRVLNVAPDRRALIQPAPESTDRAELRMASASATHEYARGQERRRQRALRGLPPPAEHAMTQRVWRAIVRTGGRVVDES